MKHRSNLLRTTRIVLATLFFAAVTLLFLGVGWQFNLWFAWVAKVQFLPALMALDFVVLAILIVLTLIFGRLYCSVICPLGVMQDIFSWFGKRQKRNRYSYSSEKRLLRYSVLVLFVVCLVIGFAPVTTLLAPYSAYGRIVNSLFRPLYDLLQKRIGCDRHPFRVVSDSRSGTLVTQCNNTYRCYTHFGSTRHFSVAKWQNLLQHHLSRRNYTLILCPFLALAYTG